MLKSIWDVDSTLFYLLSDSNLIFALSNNISSGSFKYTFKSHSNAFNYQFLAINEWIFIKVFIDMGVSNANSGQTKIQIHKKNTTPVNQEFSYSSSANAIYALDKNKMKFVYGNYPKLNLGFYPPCSIVRYVKNVKKQS